ncbi:hypothetical protein A8709_28315 [Paenibacillus pectinilyticus]|uniref:Uncharacterized protein n=1 Tax=Paenibacillus pectinilyticus TaxID=512399 RepID=A0A1C0ZUQ9_9BACL|nr:hypothetical protein A8709_28315 [Paenibacillus pectinilyticus]
MLTSSKFFAKKTGIVSSTEIGGIYLKTRHRKSLLLVACAMPLLYGNAYILGILKNSNGFSIITKILYKISNPFMKKANLTFFYHIRKYNFSVPENVLIIGDKNYL